MDDLIGRKFGEVLRRLRKEAGMSQEELGGVAGLQRKYISLLELGEKQPSLNSVFNLAHALRLSASELVAFVERECE